MIEVTLDFMLLKRKMSSKELAEKVGITPANLSILKTGKAHGVRFDTLSKICEVLDCQPRDLTTMQKKEIETGVPYALQDEEPDDMYAYEREDW